MALGSWSPSMGTGYIAHELPVLSKQTSRSIYLLAILVIAVTGTIERTWLPFVVVAVIFTGATRLYSQASRPFLKPDKFQELPLTQITKVSHNVKVYRFSLPSATQVLGLPVGQHISLAATPNGCTKEVVRSYTPISANEDQGHVDFMIKTYPNGNISGYMDSLKIGDVMKLRGPKGAMTYTPNMCKHIGMIAGGTGITPMLQIIKAVRRGRSTGDRTKIDLIFANVNAEDILLKDELDTVAREDPGFSVYYVLNHPPSEWGGGVGFVTSEMIKSHLPTPGPDMKLMMCGPPPMVGAMKKLVEDLGYEKARAVSKIDDQVFCF